MSDNQIIVAKYSEKTQTLNETVPNNGALVIFYYNSGQIGFIYPVNPDNNENDLKVLKETMLKMATSDTSLPDSQLTVVSNNNELKKQLRETLDSYPITYNHKDVEKNQKYQLYLKDGSLSTRESNESQANMLTNKDLQR